jgi:parallel beta-helix repeat protein
MQCIYGKNRLTFAGITVATALLLASGYQNLNSANAACASYSSSSNTITVSCSSATIPKIARDVNNSNVLRSLGSGQWLLRAVLQVNNGAELTISAPGVVWLKVAGSNTGLVIYGKINISGSKITSWDTSKGAPIPQTSSGSTPRAYINLRGSEGGTISGAEIAYIGYSSTGKRGLDLYGSGSSHDLTITGNSRFHDNWRGFYSSNAYNIVIENSEFYNNIDYTIDPWGGTHHMRVTNVHVHHNKGIGIICSFKCSYITFENNEVHDNGGAGLFFSRGTTNSIMRNNVVYNQPGDAYPIAVSVSESHNNRVYGNRISDSEIGITVHNPSTPDEDGVSTDNIIRGNTLERVKYAFRALSSAENTFTSNAFGTVTGNHYLIGSSASITIDHQKFSNTTIRAMSGHNDVTITKSGTIKIGSSTYNTDLTPYKTTLSGQTITINSVTT